jgi:ethanolamine transporter EutH
MVTVVERLRQRVDPTPGMALVAVVDLALVGAFVVAGEISHNIDPVANPLYVLDTYTPFLLGWLLAALLGGLYSSDALATPRRALVWTGLAWIGAAIVAQALRATALFHGDAALTFFLVSVGVGLALLVPWRVGLAVYRAL